MADAITLIKKKKNASPITTSTTGQFIAPPQYANLTPRSGSDDRRGGRAGGHAKGGAEAKDRLREHEVGAERIVTVTWAGRVGSLPRTTTTEIVGSAMASDGQPPCSPQRDRPDQTRELLDLFDEPVAARAVLAHRGTDLKRVARRALPRRPPRPVGNLYAGRSNTAWCRRVVSSVVLAQSRADHAGTEEHDASRGAFRGSSTVSDLNGAALPHRERSLTLRIALKVRCIGDDLNGR
jgi:hypothetical protein